MSRERYESLAKSLYSFKEIFEAAGFRITSRDKLRDGTGDVVTWSRDLDEAAYDFMITSENEPAFLTSPPHTKGQWSKFDLIRLLHAHGEYAITRDLVETGEVLGSSGLRSLINARRIESAQESAKPLPDGSLADTDAFSRRVAESFLRRTADQEAQRIIETSEAIRIGEEWTSLTSSEFHERVGILNWEEVWEDTTEETWFVPGFVCARRAHSLYAPSGLGKSLLCMEVAACMAAGRSVWGLPAQAPIRVLYIDNENTPLGDIRPRLMAMGFEPGDLRNLYYASFPEMGPLNRQEGGEALSAVMDRIQPDFVFFDTFSRFLEGDENLSRTAQDFYNWTGKMLKKRGIGYMRLDHSGKNTAVGARGSSAKIDDLDLIWSMTEGAEENTYKVANEKERVPVSQKVILLTRCTSPLRHELQVDGPWAELMAIAARFDAAVDLIRDLKAKSPSHSLGQSKTWSDLRDVCKEQKIARRDLFGALDFYKEHEMIDR